MGDITPHCGVSPEEKKRLEAEAVQRMVDMVGPKTHAGETQCCCVCVVVVVCVCVCGVWCVVRAP